MAKPRSKVKDYFVYLVVRMVVCFLQMLSFETARSLASLLARLACWLDRRHRLVARDNLKHAFSTRFSEQQLDQLVKAVYVHFCELLIEIIHMPRKLHIYNWKRYLELTSGDKVVSALLSERPLLMVTGHFGNWELAGYALGMFGFRTYAVARTLDNPYLDRFLRRFREGTGQQILDKNRDYERMLDIMSSGGKIATLADQSAGQRGLFVDFFGRPASTHKAIALLSLQFQCPLMVIGVRKTTRERYRLIVADIIDPADYDGNRNAVRDITQRFTTALERMVRSAPEQYFWLHNRWKHQPKPRQRKAA
ncbi:MAG: lipid A biosynthesis lauroyl acyltransferase [Gemmatales bacterium]|nr:MAG: lipid A biosynthesis lauroyl acyltransferase [Gemmatales bacterium]